MRTLTIILLAILVASCSGSKENNTHTSGQEQPVAEDSLIDEGEYAHAQPELRTILPRIDSLNLKAPFYTKTNGRIILYVCSGNWERPTYEERSKYPRGGDVKYGLLDIHLNQLLPIEYDKIYNPDLTTYGHIEIEKDNKKGLFNYILNKVIACEFDVIFPPNGKEIAIGRIGNDYYKITDIGKEKISSENSIPRYKNILSNFEFDQADSTLNFVYDSYIEYWEGDPMEGGAIVITPSYLDVLQFLPEIQMGIISAHNEEFGIAKSKSETSISQQVSNTISAFVTSFYEEGIDGRGYNLNRKNLVVVNESNEIVASEEIVRFYEYNDYYFCQPEFSRITFVNDSVIEEIRYAMENTGYDKYRSMPTYNYTLIESDGRLTPLSSNRIFDFTKYHVIDTSYFSDCFSQVTPDTEKYSGPIAVTDHYDIEDLDFMRNEIYAEYGYRFKSDKWEKYFSGKRWYSPQHDNVDDLMSDIDKQNVQTILSVKAQLEENGEHMINQRIVEFGMAG